MLGLHVYGMAAPTAAMDDMEVANSKISAVHAASGLAPSGQWADAKEKNSPAKVREPTDPAMSTAQALLASSVVSLDGLHAFDAALMARPPRKSAPRPWLMSITHSDNSIRRSLSSIRLRVSSTNSSNALRCLNCSRAVIFETLPVASPRSSGPCPPAPCCRSAGSANLRSRSTSGTMPPVMLTPHESGMPLATLATWFSEANSAVMSAEQ
mmetsp:Transcript_86827/g.230710  ORF Transcript_86827/g.230710 Transcript_86827/m.230710 type:complete len:211 (-) Transcript_86827:429-1061(-)